MTILVIIAVAIAVLSYVRFSGLRKPIAPMRPITTIALPDGFQPVRVVVVTDVRAFLRQRDTDVLCDIVIIVDSLLQTALADVAALRQLAQRAPTYYVWHEQDYEGNIQLADAHLREANIRILSDQFVRFEGEEAQLLQIEGEDGRGHRPMDYSFSEQVAHHKWLVCAKHDKINLTNEYALVLQPTQLHYCSDVNEWQTVRLTNRHCAYLFEISQ